MVSLTSEQLSEANRVAALYPNTEVGVDYLPHYDLAAWGPVAYAHDGDSGFDLRAAIQFSCRLGPGDRQIIPSGIRVKLAPNTELQVRSRSGTSWKQGLVVLNSPGTIDSIYTGEVGIIVINHSRTTMCVEPGAKIAQAVIAPVLRAAFVSFVDTETTRGADGFGSTGT
jgi:dUTP pyrophosphatase